MPLKDALVLVLLRFPQEIVSPDEFKMPKGGLTAYRVSAKEVAMAQELVESMAVDFDPSAYVDDFRKRLRAVIDTRLKAQEETVVTSGPDSEEMPEKATTNVVDFMALLRKSLDGKTKATGGADEVKGGRTRQAAATGKSKTAKNKTAQVQSKNTRAGVARKSERAIKGSSKNGKVPAKSSARTARKQPARKRAA
jgi:DNA end-binding protein Ku